MRSLSTGNTSTLGHVNSIHVDRATEYLTASAQGAEALSAYLGCKRDEVYPYATGASEVHIKNLLEVIAELTGGAA